MNGIDLTDGEVLRNVCREIDARGEQKEWRQALVQFLSRVRATDLAQRKTIEFQRVLWDDTSISATGMGTVNIEAALTDEGFRNWFADAVSQQIPSMYPERTSALSTLYIQLQERIASFSTRTPHLKILRTLAALFPEDFTTITNRNSLRRVAKAMGVSVLGDEVEWSRRILDRLNAVLGPIPSEDLKFAVDRMTLPWGILAEMSRVGAEPTVAFLPSGNEQLKPIPAVRRRKGLLAIGGYLADVLNTLDFIKDGVTKDELLAFIRQGKPNLKDSSIATQLNSLRSEFDLIRQEGAGYRLTERGEALLETQDPDVLKDWLLVRVFGVDHVLFRLKQGRAKKDELLRYVQQQNANWTTSFAPSALCQWMLSLDLVRDEGAGVLSLTERGNSWCESIHWTPEALSKVESATLPVDDFVTSDVGELARPSLPEIVERIAKAADLVFAPELVASLHMGLWANQVRHFAVLTGLSGSGKTQLARQYARALTKTEAEAGGRFLTVAVQPGWYDPAPLLGYVNPLGTGTYEGTAFLDLLLHAIEEPLQPHVVILDEFNLSHPEQYMAPLLSAMETGAPLELHNRGEHFDGVPARISYPANLVIIGTVNMDETTMGLSDKVLDRAFTLEFWDIDIDKWPGWQRTAMESQDVQSVQQLLRKLMEALKPARLHFGWRVIDEVMGFLAIRHKEGGLHLQAALDQVIYAKLLPKLRGDDSNRFRNSLSRCSEILEEEKLLRSAAKVKELQRDLEESGSARFWR